MRIIGQWSVPSIAYPGQIREIIGVDFADASPHDKIRHLRAMINLAATDPLIEELAMKITATCTSRDDLCEAEALQQWTQRMRYSDDGIQTFRAAHVTLDHADAGANCANQVLVFGAMCQSIGIPVRLNVLSRRRSLFAIDPFHVWASVGIPRRAPQEWIDAETILHVPLGWSPADYARAHPEAAL
jgi:transglutaminase-like putative cysteine protease